MNGTFDFGDSQLSCVSQINSQKGIPRKLETNISHTSARGINSYE